MDVDKLKVGQEADVRIDAYPDLGFKGKVEKVGIIAKEKGRYGTSDVKVFDVEVTLDGTDVRLKPGMSAKATIHIDKVDGALCVPVEAILEEGGEHYVYVMGSRARTKVKVELGKSNNDYVQVTSGIAEGDVVVLGPAEVPGAERSGG